MSLYLLGRCIPLDESIEEKVPIFRKMFCRALFRAAHGAKQIKICRGGRSRASAPFAPAGAKPNKIVFAALARIHPLHFTPAGAK